MLTKENKKKLKIATNNVKKIMGNIRLKKLAKEYVKKTKDNKYWPKNGAANKMMKNRMQKQDREKNGMDSGMDYGADYFSLGKISEGLGLLSQAAGLGQGIISFFGRR